MNKLIIRNLILAIILVVLLIVVFIFRDRTPFGKSQTSFAADPGKEITKIELTADGERLVLEKYRTEWKINGKHEARKSSILFMIDILKEIRIKSPVSPEIFEKEITALGIRPVKVRVFNGNRHMKSFYVYSTRSNIYGNIMKRKPGSKPFIVSVPGLESDIGSVFTTDELFWRPFIIFNQLPSRISSVTLENIADSASSFRLERSSGKFRLYDRNFELTGWDTMRVRRYISYFTLITFERWAMELDNNVIERIKGSTPLYRIHLTNTDGSKILLTLWEKRNDENGTIDSDRLWARTDAGEGIFIVRYFDIDPILKKRSYFFRQ